MNNLKEIVTKAVLGKTKKSSKENLEIKLEESIDNILGCWIINHNFSGIKNGSSVEVNGSYDLNIWYSYDGNSKTNVIVRNFTYSDTINVKLKNNENISESSEVIVHSLNSPTVSDVHLEENLIKLTVEKELAVEIVGDMKVRINTVDDYDDYDEEEIENDMDIEIDEDYLNSNE